MASKDNGKFPYEIHRLNEEDMAEAFKNIEGGSMKYFVRVGPKGYFYADAFESLIPKIYNLELRPDDVFVVTFAKAGTTWTQELVWLIANNLDYKTAKEIPLFERFPFLELSVFTSNDLGKAAIKKAIEEDESKIKFAQNLDDSGPELVSKLPSPRFMKTHQPFSLLPPDILGRTKVVYVARDPRDVAVSYFHHEKNMPYYGFKGDFKDFWKKFKNDMVEWAPFFSHFKEAWALKDHPNMLLLFYEELSKDLPDVIHRVSKFLGKTVTEEQLPALCEHLKFENFKNNKAVNCDIFKQLGIILKDKDFIRKGKAGGWRDYFDEEMTKDAELWMEEGLRGIDFKFDFLERK